MGYVVFVVYLHVQILWSVIMGVDASPSPQVFGVYVISMCRWSLLVKHG